MSNVVVIPVYQSTIFEREVKSFEQCCKVLSMHTLCLVTYAELDCTIYEEIAVANDVQLQRENFDDYYFSGIPGYNKLMMSKEFYLRFKRYDYMLIYQLDAYVFRDDLNMWCAKGYDYIGAPWFFNCDSYENGAELWKVGNGGFSLRKISTHVNILTMRRPVLTMKDLIKRTHGFPFFKRIGSIFAHWVGWHNTIDYFVRTYVDFEDFFWCEKVPSLCLDYKIPTAEEAIAFSFEISPSYLYQCNNQCLPFGCHAWHKYEYEKFWKQHIPL